MRLRCLAGRYAGQIQDYSPIAGMNALRTGMAERIDAARAPAATAAAVAEPAVMTPSAAAQTPPAAGGESRKKRK